MRCALLFCLSCYLVNLKDNPLNLHCIFLRILIFSGGLRIVLLEEEDAIAAFLRRRAQVSAVALSSAWSDERELLKEVEQGPGEVRTVTERVMVDTRGQVLFGVDPTSTPPNTGKKSREISGKKTPEKSANKIPFLYEGSKIPFLNEGSKIPFLNEGSKIRSENSGSKIPSENSEIELPEADFSKIPPQNSGKELTLVAERTVRTRECGGDDVEWEWTEVDEVGNRVHVQHTVHEQRTAIEMKHTICLQTTASSAMHLLAQESRSEQELAQKDVDAFEEQLAQFERTLALDAHA